MNKFEMPPSERPEFEPTIREYVVNPNFESIDKMEQDFFDVLKKQGWDEDNAGMAQIVFREWLINAMEYGSMRLKKDGLSKEDFDSKVMELAKDVEVQKRKILVRLFTRSPQTVKAEIQDNGRVNKKEELDMSWAKMDDADLDQHIKDNLLKPEHRGFDLTRKFLGPKDRAFVANQEGRKVSLTFNLERFQEKSKQAKEKNEF